MEHSMVVVCMRECVWTMLLKGADGRQVKENGLEVNLVVGQGVLWKEKLGTEAASILAVQNCTCTGTRSLSAVGDGDSAGWGRVGWACGVRGEWLV